MEAQHLSVSTAVKMIVIKHKWPNFCAEFLSDHSDVILCGILRESKVSAQFPRNYVQNFSFCILDSIIKNP